MSILDETAVPTGAAVSIGAPTTADQTADDFRCGICLEVWTSPVEAVPCAHVYCQACISSWLARCSSCPKCPLCQSTLGGDSARARGQHANDDDDNDNGGDDMGQLGAAPLTREVAATLKARADAVTVRCGGCSWEGPAAARREHAASGTCDNCPWRPPTVAQEAEAGGGAAAREKYLAVDPFAPWAPAIGSTGTDLATSPSGMQHLSHYRLHAPNQPQHFGRGGFGRSPRFGMYYPQASGLVMGAAPSAAGRVAADLHRYAVGGMSPQAGGDADLFLFLQVRLDHAWACYDGSVQQTIYHQTSNARGRTSWPPENLFVDIRDNLYEVDWTAMEQRNLHTGATRAVRWVALPPALAVRARLVPPAGAGGAAAAAAVAANTTASRGAALVDAAAGAAATRGARPRAILEARSDQGWQPYDVVAQQAVRAALSRDELTADVGFGGHSYKLDLAEMTQTNLAIGTTRALRWSILW